MNYEHRNENAKCHEKHGHGLNEGQPEQHGRHEMRDRHHGEEKPEGATHMLHGEAHAGHEGHEGHEGHGDHGLRGGREGREGHEGHTGHGRADRDEAGHELGMERHGHVPGRHGYEHNGGRARRGEVRYILMDALRSGPKHGYEMAKVLEERSQGRYVPSPGVTYPTLQLLLDEGMVSASQEGDRRVYQLTDAGQAELQAHAAEVEGFWERFEVSDTAQASRHEVTFLQEEIDSLTRSTWGGLEEAIARGDLETIRRVRQAVVRCRDEVRSIISGEA